MSGHVLRVGAFQLFLRWCHLQKTHGWNCCFVLDTAGATGDGSLATAHGTSGVLIARDAQTASAPQHEPAFAAIFRQVNLDEELEEMLRP